MSSQSPLPDIITGSTNSAGRVSSSRSRIAVRKPQPLSAGEIPPLTNPTVDPHSQDVMPTSTERMQTPLESKTFTTPLNPSSVDSGLNRRKGWMASASKRLGISKPNIKTSDIGPPTLLHPSLSPFPAMRRPDVSESTTLTTEADNCQIPSQIPRMRTSVFASAQSSPFPPLTSPDKPLPSLPVATIAAKSPVNRRSLIDANERPLRRSLSPRSGSTATEEWPALSPERPDSGMSKHQPPTDIKPNVGESMIEGIRGLCLEDHVPALPPRADDRPDVPNINDPANIDPILGARCSTSSSQCLSEPSIRSPALHDSSQKAAASPLRAQTKTPPVPGDTKTSAMRLPLSGSSIDEMDDESGFSQTGTGRQHLDLSGVSPEDVNLSVIDDASGLLRANACSCYAVTPHGSPYLLSSRSKSQLPNVQRKTSLADNPTYSVPAPRTGSTDSKAEVRQSQVVMVKTARSSGSAKRRTSIPLPSRLIRRMPDEDSEGDVSAERVRKTTVSRIEPDPHDADIDTESKEKSMRRLNKSTSSNKQASEQSNLLSFSELMATPPPAPDEHGYSSDSSEESIRGYDKNGGFTVKKVRGKGGATLRISDDACWLLSPEHHGSEDAQDNSGTQQFSGSGLRQAVTLKEHLRRSGGAIKSQVKLPRSSTERSLARLAAMDANDDDPDCVGDVSEGENAGNFGDLQTTPIEPGAKLVVEKEPMFNPSKSYGETDMRSQSADKRSAMVQGDWPIKDFRIMTPVDEASGSVIKASNSPWIPPMDWDVEMAQGDTSGISDTTPRPPAPPNTPISDAKDGYSQRKVTSDSSIGADRIPTPRSSRYQSGYTPRSSSFDSVKRSYPPRSTSRQGVPQQHQRRAPSFLSPVKESPERLVENRQAHNSFGNQLKQTSQPKHEKTFSDSMKDIKQSFEAVTPSSPATPALPATSSVKKPMSTLRSLFHKKSHEFSLGSRRTKKQGVAVQSISSPVAATPTPVNDTLRSQSASLGVHDVSPSQSGIVAPAMAKPTVPRKPVPNFKNADDSPLMEKAQLEPPEIRAGAQTALKILDIARAEKMEDKRDLLAELGKTAAEVVNSARDAETANEHAKQAAAQAEQAAAEAQIHALENKMALLKTTEILEKLVTGD